MLHRPLDCHTTPSTFYQHVSGSLQPVSSFSSFVSWLKAWHQRYLIHFRKNAKRNELGITFPQGESIWRPTSAYLRTWANTWTLVLYKRLVKPLQRSQLSQLSACHSATHWHLRCEEGDGAIWHVETSANTADASAVLDGFAFLETWQKVKTNDRSGFLRISCQFWRLILFVFKL